MIEDATGDFYGTTKFGGGSSVCAGGCGTVFKLSPTGTETVLYSFTGADGAFPVAGLIQDAAGNLYGTTEEGASGFGVVFKLGATGTEAVLYSFRGGADGLEPFAGLVQDASGKLYGTTINGGASDNGVVFRLTP